jgi:sRNA-binding carbon storage regulator CsrA
MFVTTLHTREGLRLILPDKSEILVLIVDAAQGKARLGIEADKSVVIRREEASPKPEESK